MATRRERVVLELDDQFTAKMTKAAAAAALFDRQIASSNRSVDVFGREVSAAEGHVGRLSGTVTRSTRDLDLYSGRLGLIVKSIGALGPAAIPITGVAIPAVTGLAQQLGLAALAGGTAVLAFQGVGDALKAMNKAHLEPTAANIEKARVAMERLSPAAQDLVLKLGSMRDELRQLKDAAGSGILPGATAALTELESRIPIVERILRETSMAMGDALRDGAESLAGPEWDRFFNFIATEARPELTKLAKSVGNVAHGLGEMWVAFGPLNSDFSSWMLQASRDFNAWATGLSATEGFQEFVAYIRETGPLVGDALASIGNALVQIVQAAAPIGGPVLRAISGVADAIAAIADSPLGTPIFGAIAAFSALSLAMKAWEGIATTSVGKFIAGQQKARLSVLGVVSAQERAIMTSGQMAARQAAGRRAMLGMAGQAATLGLVMSGTADKVGLSNTAMLGLAGSMAGPWGAAAGSAIGLTMDLAKRNNELADAIERANSAASDPGSLADLVAARDALAAGFAEVTNGTGFTGNLDRILSFVQGDVGETEEALFALETQIILTTQSQEFHAMGLGLTANGYKLATASVEEFDAALSESLGLLDKRGALRAYQSALDALDASIKANGRSLDIHTEQGRANQDSLDAIAAKAITAAGKINDPIKRANFLEGARAALIKAIEKFDIGHDRAVRLADKLLDVGKIKVNPQINVDTRAAEASLSRLRAQLIAMDADLGNLLLPGPGGVTPKQFNNPQPSNALIQESKDGGFISGPGGPRDDKIPARLSNGEFVVNAAATARHRDALEAINAQKFANGGLVTYNANRDRSFAQRSGASQNRMSVNLGDLRVTGTLQTPWGPAQVEGIARTAARNELADSAALAGTRQRMNSGGGVRG